MFGKVSDSQFSTISNSNDRGTIICKTPSVLRSYHIKWEIHNFLFILKDVGQCIKSSTFTTGTDPKIEWYIQLSPNGYKTEGDVSVYLCNKSQVETTVEFSFSILDIERTRCCSAETCIKKFTTSTTNWGYLKVTTQEELKENNKLLPDGTLTILFEFRVLENLEDSCTYPKINTIDSLSEDFKNLLTTPEWSDITISVGEKKFPAHKTILVTRSTVFAAMFKNDLEESRSNIVEISDIEPEVMEEVLLYMYTGKCNNVNNMAKELIHVADKYDLSGLKYLCGEVLGEQLSCENAADTLIIADLYKNKELKHKTLQFINNHSKEVLCSSSWKKLAATNPILEMEILHSMVNHHIMLK